MNSWRRKILHQDQMPSFEFEKIAPSNRREQVLVVLQSLEIPFVDDEGDNVAAVSLKKHPQRETFPEGMEEVMFSSNEEMMLIERKDNVSMMALDDTRLES